MGSSCDVDASLVGNGASWRFHTFKALHFVPLTAGIDWPRLGVYHSPLLAIAHFPITLESIWTVTMFFSVPSTETLRHAVSGPYLDHANAYAHQYRIHRVKNE